LAACAAVDTPTIAATPVTAPAVPAATVKTWRREIPLDSVMARYPSLMMDGWLTLSGLAPRRLDLEQRICADLLLRGSFTTLPCRKLIRDN
jgi:hypothetical protein